MSVYSCLNSEQLGQHYMCLSHHLMGFVCFVLLLFCVFSPLYDTRRCNLFSSPNLPCKLWIYYLSGQTVFCCMAVVRCELNDYPIAGAVQGLAFCWSVTAMLILGLYIIFSVRKEQLIPANRLMAMFAVCCLLYIVILFATAAASSDDHDALQLQVFILLSTFIAVFILGLSQFFVHRYTERQQPLFLLVGVLLLVVATVAVPVLTFVEGLLPALCRVLFTLGVSAATVAY
mmetsp:Transcript_21595/g.34664  ORF Transcript_21595/g.34664 Transcript_21595/m.34664 type:complete len:231 (+) Transcript_21595:34-726(+)